MNNMKVMKEVRERQQMTARELADLAGVSIRYVYALESGERVNPSRNVLVRLSTALDVPMYTIAH